MRALLSRRWPWIVSTAVHAVVVLVLALNLLDSRSRAASAPIQIEMALTPEVASIATPAPEEVKPTEPPEEIIKAEKPVEIPPAEAIPLVEPMPLLAEVQPVVPIEIKPVLPPPPKPVVRAPTPVVAKTPPTEAPPVEAPPQVAAAPAAPMPPQLAALPPMAGRPGADADYFTAVLAWQEKHKEYPRQAQIRRIQGTTVLEFELDRLGHVLSYRIKTSSGSPELDREVEAMIKRAEPLPPMPSDMTEAKLDLVVPVQFRLR